MNGCSFVDYFAGDMVNDSNKNHIRVWMLSLGIVWAEHLMSN
jgi:hypothetical protein